MRHLGLIGGIGPAATVWYYRGLTAGAAAAGLDLELTISHARVSDLVANAVGGKPERQAEIFRDHMLRCQAAGADLGIVTSLAGHFCRKQFAAISPLPLVDAIDALRAHFKAQGIGRIGLLGSAPVAKSGLYGAIPEVEFLVPEGDALMGTHDAYIAMATAGRVSDAQRSYFFDVGHGLIAQGAEAVLLSGTDLFLAFEDQDPGYPVIDGASVHVAACLEAAQRG